MQYLLPDIDKVNRVGAMPFRTWDGQLVIPVSIGGWRRVRPLDLALMLPASRRLILVRDMEE